MDVQQPIRRREFLATSAVAGAAIGTSLGDLLADETGVSKLEPAQFQSCVGESFAAGNTSLTLKSCDVHKLARHDRRPAGSRQPFSLLFEVADKQPLDSESVTLKHAKFGRMSLNVSRTYGSDDKKHYVEAVFG